MMLATKLYPPQRHAGALVRARLLNALNAHLDRRLQLVVAPAGFGKTTLLGDFARDTAAAVCWATLDAAERDLTDFIELLIEALRRRIPAMGARTYAALRGAPDPERRVAALARVVAGEVEAHIDALTVLILDDFHTVNDSASVMQFVSELLHLLPDNLRLVISSRAFPNLSLSRLMLEEQVFGLRDADLRFTAEELTALLRRLPGRDLTPEQAAALAQGAEGWIAGFLLSVPRLREELVGGLFADREDERPLYDYLAAEAFDRQSADVQQFLLATAVPATADPELCVALLGPGDWRAMVNRVEANGLFLTRLGTGGAFRYHQLFRGFLQARLRETNPDAYARLQLRTAAHLAERGEWQAATAHYLEAGAASEAAAQVAGAVPDLERRGRWQVLAAAVAGLPPEALAPYPNLQLAAAWAAQMMADFARAETLAEAVCAHGARSGDRSLEGRAMARLGMIRRMQGRTREAVDILERARTLAPEDEELAATVHFYLGQCLGIQGDLAGATAELRAALAYFEAHGPAHKATEAEAILAQALKLSGRLAEATALFESVRVRRRRQGATDAESHVLSTLGEIYLQRGEYERARASLEQAIARAHEASNWRIEVGVLTTLGQLHATLGDLSAAADAFARALAPLQERDDPLAEAQVCEGRALVAIFAGDPVEAETLVHRAIALARRQDSRYLEARCSLVLGAIHLRAGRTEQALATLQGAAETLNRSEARWEATHAQLWLAQAHHAAGTTAAARHHLRTALRMAADLETDAVFDLHVRWDPALFVEAAAAEIEPRRLLAVLQRVPAPRDEMPAQPAASPGVTARGFGPGTAVVDGAREVSWGLDKAREVFFLLLHGGPGRQEQLTTALWPDAPAAKAQTSFYTAVSRLRRAIHRDVIVRRDGLYRVNEAIVTWYDVREFERLLEAAAVGTGDAAVTLLQQAVDLYTGPLLEGLDAEWCADERERIERRYLTALEQLSEAYAAAGRLHESIAIAERLVARDPLREDVHAHLIRAHLRLGNRAAALQQFERCAALLDSELGVRPGPELQALGKRVKT